jgi:ABC-type lipoprotein release transport system permease subunit
MPERERTSSIGYQRRATGRSDRPHDLLHVRADKASVLRLILGHGLALACAGLVLGLAGAAAATRLLETVLFQVRPIDIQVYLGVIGLVAIVTLLAGYVPAWRAAGVNPVEVLKAE